jgi:hypothetical protein
LQSLATALQQVAEKCMSWKLGLKPAANPKHLRGAEAPLLQGKAVPLTFSAACQESRVTIETSD